MSKKIAEGAESLVLDVKVGSGAFMKDLPSARALAEALVAIGVEHGVRISALLTDMSVPLGRAVGNAVEVAESVDVLRGGGPADVVELTVALASEMLSLAGISADPAAVLASGEAYEVWARMIRAQGGDPEAALPVAAHKHVVAAPASGVLSAGRLRRRGGGVAARCGRARKEDPVQAGAGVLCLAKPGDAVEAGQPLLELYTDTPDAVDGALQALEGAYSVTGSAPERSPLVIDTIRG